MGDQVSFPIKSGYYNKFPDPEAYSRKFRKRPLQNDGRASSLCALKHISIQSIEQR